MRPVIGIDLGTTNTVVSVVREGQAAALLDENSQTLIPSVVSFHPNGSVLVGRSAKERRRVDAKNTIYSIKRLIGRAWDSEEVATARTRFPFEMREGPGKAALVAARGETYTLPEISAFVLRKAKSIAEAALGGSVDRAVITVPANFNDLQRAATKVAGRVAGLEVMRILNEPTAAALAYGYGKTSTERIAVYDFGGGTFDVTLLDLSNNVFEVLATAGDTFLGGDDIDFAIAERIADAFLAEHRYDARSDRQVFELIRAHAEDLKIRLSTENEAKISIGDVAHGPGGRALDLEFSLSRAELEAIAKPIVDRTFDVCREALGIARQDVDAFSEVLLVGGSTRMPFVKARVEEFFGREVKCTINPDEVVAIGAAIQANALSGQEKRRATIPPMPKVAARTKPGIIDSARAPAPPVPPPPTSSKRLPPTEADPGAVFDTAAVVPSTQPFFGQKKGVTTPGLGPTSTGPDTLVGLGARGKTKTGPGLGPAATSAQVLSGPTLVSASEQAQRAREAIREVVRVSEDDVPLPLVTPEDNTPQAPEALVSKAVNRSVGGEEASSRYGNLPLIMPATPTARVTFPSDADVFRVSDDDLEETTAPVGEPALEAIARAHRSATDDEPTKVQALPVVPAAPVLGLVQGPDSQAPTPQVQGRPLPPPPPPWPVPQQPSAVRTQPFPNTTQVMPAVQAPPMPVPVAPMPVPTAPTQTARMPSVPAPSAPPPILVDVTPLRLAVETVNGFCDTIIERNTVVPCERTRTFVTAADNQTFVRVRISQGESRHFGHNTVLGEVELSGLRAARRGEVQIAVTFALDTNGMLNITAQEVATGRATSTNLRLIGLPDAQGIHQMTERSAQRMFQ